MALIIEIVLEQIYFILDFLGFVDSPLRKCVFNSDVWRWDWFCPFLPILGWCSDLDPFSFHF